MGNRVVALGLDGADWSLLSRWASEGKLPNIARILKLGAGGPLTSTIPPVTPPAWTTIATGKDPRKHGICGGFLKVTFSDGGWFARPYSSLDKRGLEIWDPVESIVVNFPLTYPPKQIDGIMVTGMYTPSLNADFTYPREFRGELFDVAPDYNTDVQSPLYEGSQGKFIEELYKVTRAREKLFWHLYRKDWRLLFFVITETDRIQHFLWGTDEMLDYWRHIDSFIGEVLDEVLSDGRTLVIVSDHGFTKVSRKISVNRVLLKLGYLTPRSKLLSLLVSTKMVDLAPFLLSKVYKIMPRGVEKRLTRRAVDTVKTSLWDKSSTAFVYGEGGAEYVYIRPDLSSRVRREIITRIDESLRGIVDPDAGKRVVGEVFVYDNRGGEGASTDSCPDMIILPSEGYALVEYPYNGIKNIPGSRGEHAPHGVLFAVGPDISPGKRIEGSHARDVMPTLLHILDKRIPPDVDGKVLRSMFKQDSYLFRREIEYMDREELTKRELRMRARKLKAKMEGGN